MVPIAQADVALVDGLVRVDTEWTAGDVIVTTGDVQVQPGVTLTIGAGAVVKLGGDLVVLGSLKIEGTASDPVTITSAEDDQIGGETAANGETNPFDIGWVMEAPRGSTVDIIGADLHYLSGISTGRLCVPGWPIGTDEFSLSDSTVTYVSANNGQRAVIDLSGRYGSITIRNSRFAELSINGVSGRVDGGGQIIVGTTCSESTTITGNDITTQDGFFTEYPAIDAFVAVTGSTVSPTVSGNHLHGWAVAGIVVGSETLDLDRLAGNTISNPDINGGLQVTGKLAHTTGLDSFTGIVPELRDVSVPDGVTLTISAKLTRIGGLSIDGSGQIVAIGSATDLVTIEPLRAFSAATMRRYTDGESGPYDAMGLAVNGGGSIILDSVKCQHCDSRANTLISASGAESVSIVDSVFEDLSGPAIGITGNKTVPVVSRNVFDPPSGTAAYVPSFAVEIDESPIDFAQLSGNSVTASRVVGFGLAWDSLAVDSVLPWEGNMTPVITGLDVPVGVTLTLGPGAVIKGEGLRVAGTLASLGTDINPVVFTAEWDDSVGGDTGQGAIWEAYGYFVPSGTYITVDSYANVVIDHTVFMHASTAIYVNTHTVTYVSNSKFINNNRAIDAYNAVDRYQDADFESKYYQGALTLLTSVFGARTDCNPPYNDETVLMQGNWFGSSGVAGVEMGSMPDTSGVIELGDQRIDLENVLLGVQDAFAPTADPKDQPDQYKEQQKQYEEAKAKATSQAGAAQDFVGMMNDILLQPGGNSIPVTKWTCQILGEINIELVSSPVRHQGLAVADFLSEFGVLPTFPPGVENVALPFLGLTQWLNSDPYLETTTPTQAGNADLSRLAIFTAGDKYEWVKADPTPAFRPLVETDYTVTVPYETMNVNVLAVAADDSAQVAFVSKSGEWGAASNNRVVAGSPIEGQNVLEVRVTSLGGTTKTYTVTIIREGPRSDALLGDLAVSEGTLSPAFDPAVSNYTLTLDRPEICAVNLVSYAAATHDFYALIVPGDRGSRANLVSAPLITWEKLGSPHSITVEAQDGEHQRVYELGVAAPALDVTFDATGGTPANQTLTLPNAIAAVPAPSDPVRPGYTFIRWQSSTGQSLQNYGFTEDFCGATDFYAIWEPNDAAVARVSDIELDLTPGAVTSGSARQADGADAYQILVTLSGGGGAPVLGAAQSLAVSAPVGLTVSSFVDKGDGTYSASFTSTTPGSFDAWITLDGARVGTPVAVHFISATTPAAVITGRQVTAKGQGFVAGELVRVTVSGPSLDLGYLTADGSGTVEVVFMVPEDATAGAGEVVFAGTESGRTSASFEVVASPAQSVTVAFDGNGGAPALTTTTTGPGEMVALPIPPTREGFVFTEWNTAADGSGTAFSAATVVDTDVTVYAQWFPVVRGAWTVTFDGNGGAPALTMVAVVDGNTVSLPVDPVRAADEAVGMSYRFAGWNTSADGTGTVLTVGTPITADMTVYAQWVPSAPATSVAVEQGSATTTGGVARLAGGTDACTVVTTLVDGAGHPRPGLAGSLTVSVPSSVVVGDIAETAAGVYEFTVASPEPGRFGVSVLLDGLAVADPVDVNFIAAVIDQPVRTVGETQTATGLGFLPGEQVTVSVHSEPLVLGVKTAGVDGSVPVSFAVPLDFTAGKHTVVFVGESSGTVTVEFEVAAGPSVPGGGAVAATPGTGTGAVAGLVVAVLIGAGLLRRRLA
jgi:uncharacterized repeat protein (TIGR02543 family)